MMMATMGIIIESTSAESFGKSMASYSLCGRRHGLRYVLDTPATLHRFHACFETHTVGVKPSGRGAGIKAEGELHADGGHPCRRQGPGRRGAAARGHGRACLCTPAATL